jgi:hypothetical protein
MLDQLAVGSMDVLIVESMNNKSEEERNTKPVGHLSTT